MKARRQQNPAIGFDEVYAFASEVDEVQLFLAAGSQQSVFVYLVLR